MDIVLIILGAIFLIIAIVGCIIPALPGPPLGYIGLLLLHFTDKYHFDTRFLVIWAVIAIVSTILDNLIPIWGTKKYGGSKKGVWGSTIGLLIGMFFGPVGIIIGPFLGAMVGELIEGKETNDALRSAFGAFIGLLGGVVLKLVVTGFMVYYFVEALL